MSQSTNPPHDSEADVHTVIKSDSGEFPPREPATQVPPGLTARAEETVLRTPPPLPAPKSTAPQFTPPGPPTRDIPPAPGLPPGPSVAPVIAPAPAAVPAATATPAPVTRGNGASNPTPSAGREYTSPGTKFSEPAPGARLHHYEIIKLLGRGGMGSVYLARDTRLGRRVAIKFLHTTSSDLTKRFILEARTTAACSHENIVTIFEVDAWQGAPFMVFEFLAGNTLGKFMPEGKPLAPPRAVELMVPVVRALAFAHQQGIVHRDLKPDNILVTDSGVTKVLDFGIAKVLQGDEKAPEYVARPRAPKTNLEDTDDSELTQKGAMMGTLAYMAPEQWGIGVPIDHRADIWAVGIMLFKMLSGKHPLDPLRGEQLMITGLLKEPMPFLRTKAPDVPKELADAVDACLMKYASKRFPDAVALLRALEPFLPGRYTRELKIDESPYAGLSSFQESDADRFFGRRQDVAAFVNRVQERPLLGVVGPSGAGKSSFVRAGVVPALKRSGEPWESVVIRPGRSPLAGLAALISPMVGTSTSVAEDMNDQRQLAKRLRGEPGFFGAVLRSKARKDGKRLLLFVDQFEELYTLVPDAAERLAFTACLSAAADDATSPIRLVLSIRSDFLDRVPEDPRFMAELGQGLVFLQSPGVDGLREAITQPAEMAGYRFESTDIVDDMLKHLASTQGALPLLQFASTRLWEARDAAKKQLTQKAYATIGGIAGALASHADAVVGRVPAASLPLVRAIFLRLITPERTRAIVELEELKDLSRNAAEVKTLVDELVQARLLVVQTGAGTATVEIVHESLLHSWPMLKRWLEESGEDAAFLDQLRTAARQWQLKGKSDDLLWRGEPAEEALRFQRRFRGELGDTPRQFLAAVIALAAKQKGRRRAATIGAVTFLSLLLAASTVALVVVQGARTEATEQAEVAKKAEAEAKANLEVARQKEQERARAQAEAEKAAAELRVKQQEALDNLVKAEQAAETARLAELSAKKNAAAAIAARTLSQEAQRRAESARRQVTDLLGKEQERAKKLEEQLGSPVIDTLK